ncbi:MAG: hypothetical protein JSR47_13600 [Proteobacteria bacterium]|nr:hypothetical protein [Pseudomonadota bacterium]
MRFPRRDDPTDEADLDEQRMMMNRMPAPLGWGLVRGVLMLGVAAAVTYGAAMALQERASDKSQLAVAPADVGAPAPGDMRSPGISAPSATPAATP